jgi:hypothetical protein
MLGPCGKIQPGDGLLEQAFRRIVQRAMLVDLVTLAANWPVARCINWLNMLGLRFSSLPIEQATG